MNSTISFTMTSFVIRTSRFVNSVLIFLGIHIVFVSYFLMALLLSLLWLSFVCSCFCLFCKGGESGLGTVPSFLGFMPRWSHRLESSSALRAFQPEPRK